MADKEKAIETGGSTAGPETVSKADFDKLVADYQKLVGAFNRLLKEYNELHVSMLLNSEEQK